MTIWTLYIFFAARLCSDGAGTSDLFVIMPGIDRWSKRFFITFFSILFLNSCFALMEMLFFEVPGMALVHVVSISGCLCLPRCLCPR